MKRTVSGILFKISLALFLTAMGVNLLVYVIEAVLGLELYCFGVTSFTFHFTLWAICCVCGPLALLLRVKRRAIAVTLSIVFWFGCLGVVCSMAFWPERVHHSMTPYTSPSGQHAVYIAYEGMIFKQKNLLFAEKVREIHYPSSFLREGENRYSVEWDGENAVVTCQNPKGEEYAPIVVSVRFE